MFEKISALSIVKNARQGKVRDIYDLCDKLLLVASDRVSTFDVVHPTLIPDKGKILNCISTFLFTETKHIIANHFLTADINDYPVELQVYADELRDRSMLVSRTRVIPFECIVRGYITGSAWSEYKKTATIGSMMLPEGLVESQKFPHPLFTPSTKAEEGHDENISYREMLNRMDHRIAAFLKNKSLELYVFEHEKLIKEKIILADTKFEFGTINSEILLIDEILTPDSSRYWDLDSYALGKTPLSYDKQFIRDFVTAGGWDKTPPAPALPGEVVQKTREKYLQMYKIITGDTERKW